MRGEKILTILLKILEKKGSLNREELYSMVIPKEKSRDDKEKGKWRKLFSYLRKKGYIIEEIKTDGKERKVRVMKITEKGLEYLQKFRLPLPQYVLLLIAEKHPKKVSFYDLLNNQEYLDYLKFYNIDKDPEKLLKRTLRYLLQKELIKKEEGTQQFKHTIEDEYGNIKEQIEERETELYSLTDKGLEKVKENTFEKRVIVKKDDIVKENNIFFESPTFRKLPIVITRVLSIVGFAFEKIKDIVIERISKKLFRIIKGPFELIYELEREVRNAYILKLREVDLKI
jgi:DNA-binding PadR family transcriptional regulator